MIVLRAGDLRHRITIQAAHTVSDNQGGQTVTWNEFATRWGSLSPLQGKELIQAQAIQTQVTHRAKLRYVEGVLSGMRLLFRGRTFNIQSVINVDERDVILELLCTEGAAT